MRKFSRILERQPRKLSRPTRSSLRSPSRLSCSLGWVKAGAAAAALGAIIPEANQDVSKFTGISSGSLSLKIDGVSRSATGLDFSKATNYNAVASVIGTAIGSYGACAWDGSRFRITSAASGKASSVSEITSSNSDLLTALGFNSVTYSAGFDAESVDDAFTAFLDTDNCMPVLSRTRT